MVVYQGPIRVRAPTFFGRGCTPAADADRVGFLGRDRKGAFDPKLEFPPGAKVVFVAEAFVGMELKISQTHPMGLRGKRDTSAARETVVLATKMEAVQMSVRPAQGDLQGKMEISQRAVTADQQASPDPRVDLAHPHLELVDFNVRAHNRMIETGRGEP